MRQHKRWAAAVLVAVGLAACGGTTTTTVTAPPAASSPKAAAPAVMQPAGTCPKPSSSGADGGFMGCSQSASPLPPTLAFSAPRGGYFPDVSSWQGHPNWDAAHPHIVAASAKLGEYTLDPDAAYNVAAFKRLKIPYAVYWFVRPTGCAHEGELIQHYAQWLGVKLVVLDEEVPGIGGYAACLNQYVHNATGQNAVVYRSAGNDFDGSASSLACWVAAYGPSSTPSCFHKVVAWQFTDGRFGFPIYIPGIGQGDVSVDYGMFTTPKPPDPFPKADHTRRNLKGGGHAQEHNTLVTFRNAHCVFPLRRSRCRSSYAHGVQLQHRLFNVSTHNGALKPGHRHWGPPNDRGIRYAYFATQYKPRAHAAR